LVITQRRAVGSSLGDGGDMKLTRRIRAQANLIEYAPIFIILVGLAELQSGASLGLAAIAGLFFVGRVLHGYALALTEKSPFGRFWGTAATYAAIIIIVCFNVVITII
jgi:hypothetical protein